jgi:hypothetical protein
MSPLNYHQIDNVSPKLSIVTMSPPPPKTPKRPKIVNVSPNDETTLSKNIYIYIY